MRVRTYASCDWGDYEAWQKVYRFVNSKELLLVHAAFSMFTSVDIWM